MLPVQLSRPARPPAQADWSVVHRARAALRQAVARADSLLALPVYPWLLTDADMRPASSFAEAADLARPRAAPQNGAMPRYFFDTFDENRRIVDKEGFELPNLHVATRQGLAVLHAIARDEACRRAERTLSVHVRDEAGRVAFHATLTMETEVARDEATAPMVAALLPISN